MCEPFTTNAWFQAEPTKISFVPFDESSYRTSTGPLFQRATYTISGIDIQACPAQLHLLVITCFVAFVAPFGGFFVSGLKRALRRPQLGHTFKMGVIDRVDCILVTGFFLIIYIAWVVYEKQTATEKIQSMIMNLSSES